MTGEAMNKLLSDEELRVFIIEQLQDYLEGGEFSVYTPLEKERHANNIIDLINTQKRLYAEMVIGDDMVQVVKTYSSPIWTTGKYCDTCGFDIKENTQACGCTEVNKHMAEQRARINR